MSKNAELPAARCLSRAQVAELLGLTDRAVRRMDGRQLHPVRAPDRVWRYEPAEVRALLAPPGDERGGRIARVMTDGETTAAVFSLIELGKTSPQIVIETKQPADVVNSIRAEYDAMTGGLVLPPQAVAELSELVGQFKSHKTLVDAVRRALNARFEESRTEAQDFGEVLDPATGRFRKVEPFAIGSSRSDSAANRESNEGRGEQ